MSAVQTNKDMDTPHSAYPFFHWWTLGWLPPPGCWEPCCSGCERVSISSRPCLNSLASIPRSGITGLYGNCMLNTLSNRQTVCPSDCTIFQSHRTRAAVSPFPYHTGYFPFSFSYGRIQKGVRWCLLMACSTFPWRSRVQLSFHMCVGYLDKCVFEWFAHFKISLLSVF